MATRRIRGVRLTGEERLTVRRLIDTGCSFEQAAAAVRCSTKTVQRALNAVGGLRPRPHVRAPRQLSLAEREHVSRELPGGASYRAIARQLYRAPSTICREVNRNGGPYRYRAVRADAATYRRARRPKQAKLRRHPRLRTQVESMRTAIWSPEQISARLRIEYPDDPRMRVSHETIYQSLFVQTRGVPAHRAHPPAAARTQGPRWLHQGEGAHRGPPGGRGRSRGAGSLGG